MINEKIDHFSIDGHNFDRLIETDSNKISTGFYEHLYNGKTDVFLKVEKSVREDLSSGAALRFIDTKQYYYVEKGEVYHLVKNRNDMLNLFPDKKQALQQYLKKNKLKFKRNMKIAIVQLAAYYDQLSR